MFLKKRFSWIHHALSLDILGDLIGEGAFSKVYKVTNTEDGKVYAAKKVKIDFISGQENETRLMQTFTSPFIVQYAESYMDADYLYIIMEYCENGNLRTYIDGAKEKGLLCTEDVCYTYLSFLSYYCKHYFRKLGNSLLQQQMA